MAPMDAEKKAALMAKLAAGRAKAKEMRAADPTYKPRKARKSKKDAVVKDALAKPEANSTTPGIDAPVAAAVNKVAAAPVAPAPSVTSHIDVPHLPEESKLKKIVKKATAAPVPVGTGGLSATGKPKKYNANQLITNEETGMMAIETMLPGQKESIKKVLRNDKKLKPETPASHPHPADMTVDNVTKHIPDIKAAEGKAPFSFSAIRKTLYQ